MTDLSSGEARGPATLSSIFKADVLARGALQQGGSSRLGSAAWAAAKSSLRALGRAAHTLWLQITGLFFVAFAIVGGFAAIREYRVYAAGGAGLGRMLTALTFALLFAWFGITSFWRAGRR